MTNHSCITDNKTEEDVSLFEGGWMSEWVGVGVGVDEGCLNRATLTHTLKIENCDDRFPSLITHLNKYNFPSFIYDSCIYISYFYIKQCGIVCVREPYLSVAIYSDLKRLNFLNQPS
jgi:hypothetical protein